MVQLPSLREDVDPTNKKEVRAPFSEPFCRWCRLSTPMTAAPPDLLPGTLDLLILRTLQKDALHGWAISERIQQLSEDVLQINQGSLYPALHRLEHQGWIEAEWKVSELGRRAKYYRLTPSGRKQLTIETREWDRMQNAISRVMPRGLRAGFRLDAMIRRASRRWLSSASSAI